MSKPINIPKECQDCGNREGILCIGFEGIVSEEQLIVCHRYAFAGCPECQSWNVKKLHLGDGVGKYCMVCKEIVAAFKEDHWPAIPFGDPEEEPSSEVREVTLEEL